VTTVAALRLEALAVGGTRIGMRARRPLPADQLVLAGVAGAVVPGLDPGDIVVADRVVLDEGDDVLLPGATELAAALRIAGLTVHLGPVGGADRTVTGPARAAWADRGALAVDMESGVLARTGRLAAVVRAIVDTPVHPLVSLGTLPRGAGALRALRRAAPILSAWAAGRGEPAGPADVRERQAAPVVNITITLPGEVENS
jgi:4-hydroxy-3-methylbut-2-enyl diphosphate reductase